MPESVWMSRKQTAAILKSRNPSGKLVGMFMVAIPGAALLGWVVGGSTTALGSALTCLAILVVSMAAVMWARPSRA